MASDDKYLRSLLRDESEGLPPDLEWGQMREGILAAMNNPGGQASEEERPAKRRRVGVWWLSLLFVGLGLAAFTYAYLVGRPHSPQASSQSLPVGPTLASPPRAEAPEACPEAQSDDSGETGAVASAHIAPSTMSAPMASASMRRRPVSVRVIPTAPYPDHKNNGAAAATAAPAPSLDAPVPATHATIPAMQTAEEPPTFDARSLQAHHTDMEAMPQMPTLPTEALDAPAFAPHIPVAASLRQGRTWHIGVVALALREVGRPPVQGNAAAGVTAQETALYAPAAWVYAEATLHGRTYAQLGLARQQVLHRLDYQAVQRTQVLENDLVVQRQVNAVTGDTAFIRADTLLGATATRNVRHYNQSTLLSIPVHVGYRLSVGRWTLGLEAAATFNLRARHTGLHYNADDGTLAPIVDTDGALLKPQVGLALGGGLSVAYRLTPRFSLTCQGVMSQHLSHWGATPGVGPGPRLAGYGMGVRYRL